MSKYSPKPDPEATGPKSLAEYEALRRANYGPSPELAAAPKSKTPAFPPRSRFVPTPAEPVPA